MHAHATYSPRAPTVIARRRFADAAISTSHPPCAPTTPTESQTCHSRERGNPGKHQKTPARHIHAEPPCSTNAPLHTFRTVHTLCTPHPLQPPNHPVNPTPHLLKPPVSTGGRPPCVCGCHRSPTRPQRVIPAKAGIQTSNNTVRTFPPELNVPRVNCHSCTCYSIATIVLIVSTR